MSDHLQLEYYNLEGERKASVWLSNDVVNGGSVLVGENFESTKITKFSVVVSRLENRNLVTIQIDLPCNEAPETWV